MTNITIDADCEAEDNVLKVYIVKGDMTVAQFDAWIAKGTRMLRASMIMAGDVFATEAVGVDEPAKADDSRATGPATTVYKYLSVGDVRRRHDSCSYYIVIGNLRSQLSNPRDALLIRYESQQSNRVVAYEATIYKADIGDADSITITMERAGHSYYDDDYKPNTSTKWGCYFAEV